jgi:hypothetical protein
MNLLFSLLLPLTTLAFPVIDVHTHASFDNEPESTSGIMDSKEQYLKELKEIGAVAAVAHMHDGVEKMDADLAAYPILRCSGVGKNVNLRQIEKDLKSKTARCIKIYLGYVHRYAYDKAYRPIYKLAEKYDVPVVFHTGDTYTSRGKLKYSDPLTIDEVAVDFPNTTFVIAHLGNPWVESAMEVTYKNPNVYVEASAMLIGKILEDEYSLEEFLVKPLKRAFHFIEDPEKILFGSDWPLVGMNDYLTAYKRAIPEKHWCKVFYGNAVKVFRIKELEGKYDCPAPASGN